MSDPPNYRLFDIANIVPQTFKIGTISKRGYYFYLLDKLQSEDPGLIKTLFKLTAAKHAFGEVRLTCRCGCSNKHSTQLQELLNALQEQLEILYRFQVDELFGLVLVEDINAYYANVINQHNFDNIFSTQENKNGTKL